MTTLVELNLVDVSLELLTETIMQGLCANLRANPGVFRHAKGF